MNRFTIIIALLCGCAGQTPHVLDTAISGAVLVSGGTELNPLGFPSVVAAKIIAEGTAEKYRQDGNKITCVKIASTARFGSWIGTGATVGGLVAGPVGMGVGVLIAVFASEEPAFQSAVKTCYRIDNGTRTATFNSPGWGG